MPARSLLILVFSLVYLLKSEVLKAEAPPRARLLKVFDVADFGSEQLRIGDLDGDGGPDFLLAQSRYATREITSLTAFTITGKILWQTGKPSLDNGRIFSDLPLQLYDWDNDGENEVLYVQQTKYMEPWNGGETFAGRRVRERAERYEGTSTMIVLNGKTGQEESRFPIPAGADDSFLFADLTGRGRREDLVVKDRYWNAWGIGHDGKQIWHWTGSTGHFPAVADVDDDGKDEVFFGFTLIDNDGKVVFSLDPNHGWENRLKVAEPKDVRAYKRFLSVPIHSDANYIIRRKDGQWRLLFGDGGPYFLNPNGKVLWHGDKLGEAQHVVAGCFRNSSEYQVAVIDRSPKDVKFPRRDESVADLYMFDEDGNELWKQRREKGDWMIGCISMNWFGMGKNDCLLLYGRNNGKPAQLMNGDGEVVLEFTMHYLPDRSVEEPDAWKEPLGVKNFYVLAADVWGDSREEVILFGARGMCIYTNPLPSSVPTLYNESLYPGM